MSMILALLFLKRDIFCLSFPRAAYTLANKLYGGRICSYLFPTTAAAPLNMLAVGRFPETLSL
jgi:hypothetical protein